MNIRHIDAIDAEGSRARELGAILSLLAESQHLEPDVQRALWGMSHLAVEIYERLAAITNPAVRR
jgi:hypothetical protein